MFVFFPVDFLHCLLTSMDFSNFSNFFFKIGSYDIIYSFKIFFATIFLVFKSS